MDVTSAMKSPAKEHPRRIKLSFQPFQICFQDKHQNSCPPAGLFHSDLPFFTVSAVYRFFYISVSWMSHLLWSLQRMNISEKLNHLSGHSKYAFKTSIKIADPLLACSTLTFRSFTVSAVYRFFYISVSWMSHLLWSLQRRNIPEELNHHSSHSKYTFKTSIKIPDPLLACSTLTSRYFPVSAVYRFYSVSGSWMSHLLRSLQVYREVPAPSDGQTSASSLPRRRVGQRTLRDPSTGSVPQTTPAVPCRRPIMARRISVLRRPCLLRANLHRRRLWPLFSQSHPLQQSRRGNRLRLQGGTCLPNNTWQRNGSGSARRLQVYCRWCMESWSSQRLDSVTGMCPIRNYRPQHRIWVSARWNGRSR